MCLADTHHLHQVDLALCHAGALHPEPISRRSKLGRRFQNKYTGWGFFICADTAAIPLIFYEKMPVRISMCRSMVTAIDTEWGEGQCKRPHIRNMSRCSRKCV